MATQHQHRCSGVNCGNLVNCDSASCQESLSDWSVLCDECKGKKMQYLRITEDPAGQLYLERGEFDKREVYRLKEFSGYLDRTIVEGMGYLAIEKLYPDQDIEGYAEIGETLYIAKREERYIPS